MSKSENEIFWKNFDADKPDLDMQKRLQHARVGFLLEAGIKEGEEALKYAVEQMQLYDTGKNQSLNKAYIINSFRPREFDHINSNDDSLSILEQFLGDQQFEWRRGSETIKQALNKHFPSAGDVKQAGSREDVILDNLIIVGNKRVAIEIETSNNLDNGYFTLRQAVRKQKADYGVMIVTWTPKISGQADEGKALGRLDREFDNATDLRDGPIYRIAIVRGVDLCRSILKNKK